MLNNYDRKAIGASPRYGGGKRFAEAVRAAVKAFEKTGKMLDAALAYAAHGIPVFPCSMHDKAPMTPADLDPVSGEKLVGTGGFYKASCDPLIIRGWWPDKVYNPSSFFNFFPLIAVPAGTRSGVWPLDIDTMEGGHRDDGYAGWNALLAKHGGLLTREHLSASNGLHPIFEWVPGMVLGLSRGGLPKGIDVKGEGGYFIVPPSRRMSGAYTVKSDIDPIVAPKWLIDLIRNGKTSTPTRLPARAKSKKTKSTPTDLWSTFPKKLRSFPNITIPPEIIRNNPMLLMGLADPALLMSALHALPLHYSFDNIEWRAMGLRIYAATRGMEYGFEIFDWFSRFSPQQYNKKVTTRQAWESFKGSPPNRTGGAEKIYLMASEYDWVRNPVIVRPAYRAVRKQVTKKKGVKK